MPVAIRWLYADNSGQMHASESGTISPFVSGTAVLVTLKDPREKFWGLLVELTANGAIVCGIDLNSFDDFTAMLRSGEGGGFATVFFPLLRVERIELDSANGEIPSLSQRFRSVTGREVHEVFGTKVAAGSKGAR